MQVNNPYYTAGALLFKTALGAALIHRGLSKNKPEPRYASIAEILLGSALLFWATYDTKKFLPPPPPAQKFMTKERIIAIGDVHGDLDGLKENLRQARLIDTRGHWVGGKQTFVQLGDVVDRGPKAKECWQFLRDLQKEAAAAGGKVIRIAGNHELMWLEKDYRFAHPTADTPKVREQVRQWIKEDILNSNVQAGKLAANGKIAFVHAGIVDGIAQKLKGEIAQERGISPANVSNHSLIDRINALFRRAVKENRFDHPIFQAGAARGGDGAEGVFWADKSALDDQAFSSMVQIVGHNPPGWRDDPIRVNPKRNVIYADAGLYKNYGGNRCFIEIANGNIFAQCKAGAAWIQKQMAMRTRQPVTVEK